MFVALRWYRYLVFATLVFCSSQAFSVSCMMESLYPICQMTNRWFLFIPSTIWMIVHPGYVYRIYIVYIYCMVVTKRFVFNIFEILPDFLNSLNGKYSKSYFQEPRKLSFKSDVFLCNLVSKRNLTSQVERKIDVFPSLKFPLHCERLTLSDIDFPLYVRRNNMFISNQV